MTFHDQQQLSESIQEYFLKRILIPAKQLAPHHFPLLRQAILAAQKIDFITFSEVFDTLDAHTQPHECLYLGNQLRSLLAPLPSCYFLRATQKLQHGPQSPESVELNTIMAEEFIQKGNGPAFLDCIHHQRITYGQAFDALLRKNNLPCLFGLFSEIFSHHSPSNPDRKAFPLTPEQIDSFCSWAAYIRHAELSCPHPLTDLLTSLRPLFSNKNLITLWSSARDANDLLFASALLASGCTPHNQVFLGTLDPSHTHRLFPEHLANPTLAELLLYGNHRSNDPVLFSAFFQHSSLFQTHSQAIRPLILSTLNNSSLMGLEKLGVNLHSTDPQGNTLFHLQAQNSTYSRPGAPNFRAAARQWPSLFTQLNFDGKSAVDYLSVQERTEVEPALAKGEQKSLNQTLGRRVPKKKGVLGSKPRL